MHFDPVSSFGVVWSGLGWFGLASSNCCLSVRLSFAGVFVRVLWEPEMLARWGISYEMFKVEKFWWQYIVLARRSVIVGVYVAVNDHTQDRFLYVTLLNLIALMAQVLVNPFSDRINNACECVSLAVLTIVSCKL